MASNQYFEEHVPQVDSLEDKSSLKMLKSASGDSVEDSDRNGSSGFDCNICLDCVQDPMVTLCGHLYCWPCIYKWLNLRSISSDYEEKKEAQCPVCKSEISESYLVPLYGRGQITLPSKSKAQQVGILIPPRPLGPSRVVELLRSSEPTSQAFHPQQPNTILEDALTRQRVEVDAVRADSSLYNDIGGGAVAEITARLRVAKAEAARLREALELSHQNAEAARQRAEAAAKRFEAATQRVKAAAKRVEAATHRVEAATQRAEAAAKRVEAATQRVKAAAKRAKAAYHKAEVANQKAATVETNARVDAMLVTGFSAHVSTSTSQVPQQVYHDSIVDQDNQVDDHSALFKRRRHN